MGKYFGTDGFRGEANEGLTADHAYTVGRFLGWYYGELKRQAGDTSAPRIVIGKDTRRSSYMFEYSLVGGLVASGADAYLLHVTTTPSVAYVARVDEFDCGVMITASHNPYYDNGIKLINGHGEKMDEETINLVEDYIDGHLEAFGRKWTELPFAKREQIGCTVDYVSGRNRYIGYLISLGLYSFKGVKVGLDCANGASWNVAKSVFDALGAQTYVINDEPNGVNINNNAGSTHIEGLQKFVVEKGLDVGFAYDGDADRCLCVDEKGNVVTGDHILYIYARYMKDREKLTNNTVVTTIMSNFGLYKALDEAGISYAKTKVGDKYEYVGGIVNKTKNQIDAEVRTARTHVAQVAYEETFTALGYDHIKFIATLDGRTTKQCASLDGTVWQKGDSSIRRPPLHRRCRSLLVGVDKDGNIAGNRPFVAADKPVSKIPKSQRDGIIGQVDANTKYASWFAQQDADFQKNWLGKKRYELYKNGGLTLDKFTDPLGREYTIKELRALDDKIFKRLGL